MREKTFVDSAGAPELSPSHPPRPVCRSFKEKRVSCLDGALHVIVYLMYSKTNRLYLTFLRLVLQPSRVYKKNRLFHSGPEWRVPSLSKDSDILMLSLGKDDLPTSTAPYCYSKPTRG